MCRPLSSLAVFAVALLNAAHAATAGCGKTPSLQSGTHTMTINNATRQWILTLPEDYDNTKPYKVVFGLHWHMGTMKDVAYGGHFGLYNEGTILPYYGLPRHANHTAIFIAPEGVDLAYMNTQGEEISFIQEIVKLTNAELCIDEKLRFATGFSYGASMAYSIACSLSKDFRAVAAFSGGLFSGCVGGTDPVAYYGLHGTGDADLPIAEGRKLLDTFVKNNGCQDETPVEPASGSKTHTTTVFSGCSPEHPVWWTAFDSGHTPVPVDGGADDMEKTYADGEVWKFFSQFE